MADDKRSEAKRLLDTSIEAAIKDDAVPKLYANAFAVGLSNADVFIVLQRFGTQPVAVVNMSYTLAKTLSQRLGQVIADFEAKAQQKLLTTDRIDKLMSAKADPDGTDTIQ